MADAFAATQDERKRFKLQDLSDRKRTKEKPESISCTRLTWTGSEEGRKALRRWVLSTVRDGSLTGSERRAAQIMREYFNSEHGGCWVSQDTIEAETGWVASEFSRARAGLLRRGYLVKVWGRGENPHGPRQWVYCPALPNPAMDAVYW